ncbi:hypothetical protein IW261DRAFT_1343142 [Armillaria novae-zelandiae]|uniref:Uncharacterized protein n=1 Tax=Armillaria novae-zelandiae TaxID=153914 RepID=A0AA39TXM0_9AGAR|nr:hypothetical protein IW261DRAFT_1343142 [Armillaria novae-zelandiae]
MAKDHEICGKGMQNFMYTPHYHEFLHIVHSISPQTYRQLGLEVKTEDSHSIQRHMNSRPCFPLGIQERTYQFVADYISDYKYPASAPLGLSVDDTKLFAMLQPILDKTKSNAGEWYLVGNIGNTPIKIPDMAALDEFMQEADKYEKATKVSSPVGASDTISGVPPLAVAILPISAKIKAPKLAELQIDLMKGLISQGYHIVSNASDGTAVEQDCQ